MKTSPHGICLPLVIAAISPLAYGQLDSGSCSLSGPNGRSCADRGSACTASDGKSGDCVQLREGCQCAPHNICHFDHSKDAWIPIRVSVRSITTHLNHGDCTIDDGVACTLDRCDTANGCVHESIDGRCDDGDACTADTCNGQGGCANTAISCDDGNLCTIDFCIPESGCQHGTVGCTTDNNDCTDDACDPATGGCPYRPVTDGFPCDDGLNCTDGSFCLDGACVGGTSNCPQSPNECAVATCDYESGECVETCNDSEPPDCVAGYEVVCPVSPDPCFGIICFGNDGHCRSVLLGDPQDCFNVHACDTNQDCADNDACTIDSCVLVGASRVCQYEFVDPEIFCNDNNPCTIDTCHANSGCVHMPLNPIDGCGGDDGLACTTQVCDPARGGCAKDLDHSQCDDGVACTIDLCDAILGCLNPPDPSACGNGVCDLPCGEHAGNCPADCIGANSCVGTNACVGVTGQIGENSCHGINACANAGGIIGDNSCHNSFEGVNAGACVDNIGTIGNDSCYDFASCTDNSGEIGNGSCHEYESCVGNSGEIGNNSCQPWRACCFTEIDIGDNQCNGECACRGPECVLCGG